MDKLNEVKRYGLELYHCNGGEMMQEQGGGYVEYEDYALLAEAFRALEQRAEAAERERDEAEMQVRRLIGAND